MDFIKDVVDKAQRESARAKFVEHLLADNFNPKLLGIGKDGEFESNVARTRFELYMAGFNQGRYGQFNPK